MKQIENLKNLAITLILAISTWYAGHSYDSQFMAYMENQIDLVYGQIDLSEDTISRELLFIHSEIIDEKNQNEKFESSTSGNLRDINEELDLLQRMIIEMNDKLESRENSE